MGCEWSVVELRGIYYRFHERSDISPRRLRKSKRHLVSTPVRDAPRFDEMAGSAGNSQEDEGESCSDVRPSQEGVLATYP